MTEKMPPKPTVEYRDNPEQAIAEAVKKLTSYLEGLEMLSCIEENDVPRLALMLSIGQDDALQVKWLEKYAYTELKLMCSTKQKKGGIRSVQVVEVAKQ